MNYKLYYIINMNYSGGDKKREAKKKYYGQFTFQC